MSLWRFETILLLHNKDQLCNSPLARFATFLYTGLPDGAEFGKCCKNTCLQRNLPTFWQCFCAKILPYFKIPIVSIDKTNHFGWFINAYWNFRLKIQLNTICRGSFCQTLKIGKCGQNMKCKIPQVSKNHYCQQSCHFQKVFAKNLPWIWLVIFFVKHLATLPLQAKELTWVNCKLITAWDQNS